MYVVVALLVIAVAFLIFDNYILERETIEPVVSTETEQVPAVVEVEEAQKTIAVLPFVNLSSDPEQEYFVDGLSEELLNSLCQIPDLGVAGRTSSFSFQGTNKTIQGIACILGVENILDSIICKPKITSNYESTIPLNPLLIILLVTFFTKQFC